MKRYVMLFCWLILTPLAQASQNHLLIIGGIGGTDEYARDFATRVQQLYSAAIAAGVDKKNITVLNASPLTDGAPTSQISDKPTIIRTLHEIGARAQDDDRLFIVLIGHGNPRGDGAVFNLPGPDISATEFAEALTGLERQLLVIVNTASASGPFIDALSAANRVVITATSSGREYHAPIFADYFIAAFAEAGADRDKDERVSMLEAFAFARREVRRAFDSDKRLLTEHALLDDNGDGEGSQEPGEFKVDGALAHRVYLQQPPSLALGASAKLVAMQQRKQALEQSISNLKRQRESFARNDYYARLEGLLIDLALLSREIRARGD